MMKSSSAPAGDPGPRNRPAGRFLLLVLLVLVPLSILACFTTRPKTKQRSVPVAAPEQTPPAAPIAAVPGVPGQPDHAAIAELTDPTVPGRCTSAAGVCADALPAAPAPPADGLADAPAPMPRDVQAARPSPAVFRQVRGLSPRALAMALDAVACARARGVAGRGDLLTLIDYSLPSTEPRLWVLDLAHGRVLFHELVAHGAGSGDNYATRFSNLEDSRQTSLGLFLTRDTYEGGNGYSLKLAGLDAGVNDRALERKIVMHGAWYVSPDQIQRYGRIGRSWGCPALPVASAHRVIDAIKGGSFVFAYAAADGGWMKASSRRCTPPAAPSAPAAAPLALTAATIAGR